MSDGIIQRSAADAVVEAMIASGVEIVFGLPGIQIMNVVDALARRADRIRFVHTRHEHAASFMAYGYARTSGRCAAVLVVPGPGVLNAASGIGSAQLGSTPMLVIAGQIPSTGLGRGLGYLHEIADQLQVVEPLAKSAVRVLKPDEAGQAVADAVAIAREGRPGPAYVEIPPDVLTTPTAAAALPLPPRAALAASPDALERAARLLEKARRPVIVAGGGMVRGGAGPLRALAEKLRAPVITTQNGKGLVDESHPLAAGVNFYDGLGPAYALLPKADVVLAVGTRLFIRSLGVAPEQILLHVDANAAALGAWLKPTLGIVADAPRFVSDVDALVDAARCASEWSFAEASAERDRFRAQVVGLEVRACDLVAQIEEALPPDAVVVAGMNSVGYWAHLALRVHEPLRYLTPGMFGALGFEVPTAIGAKAARPSATVVCLVGDGGFLFGAEELSTAVAHDLPVVFVLFDNGSYGASQWDQETLYGGRVYGTRLKNPDFVALARAFGVDGAEVEPARVGAALRAACEERKTTVLRVAVPNMMPPFALKR